MRAAVLFAGIGGWEIACEHNGVPVAWAAEWDDWKRERYLERWPDAQLYRDVASLDGHRIVRNHGPVDLLLASPPCTDVSAANTGGAGIDGAASRYYLDAIRLARETGTRWIGFENSPRLRTRGADRVLALLEEAGYAVWPCVVEAEDAGAPHERGRSFVLGCRRDAIDGADAERARLWIKQGWRSWQDRSGAAESQKDANTNGNGQPDGAVDAEMGRSARADGGARPRTCHSDRSRLAEWQGVGGNPFEKFTAAERAALCPWDQAGDGLAGYLPVAHGLANKLRGHGLSERAAKAELARWRSALGDALVIPVVTAVVRSIIRTDQQWAPTAPARETGSTPTSCSQ